MRVSSSLVEVEVGEAVELWCSYNTWLLTIDACNFTTPGNVALVMATGAAYQEGRLDVLDGGKKSCGLRINRVEKQDFGVWR